MEPERLTGSASDQLLESPLQQSSRTREPGLHEIFCHREGLCGFCRSAVPASTFMQLAGVVEIAAGILVLSRWTRVGAYVVALWLVGIAINLLAAGHFLDAAVRDLVMACGAFTLAKLEEVRGRQSARDTAPRRAVGQVHA